MKTKTLFQFSAFCGFISGLFLVVGWTLNIGRDSLVGASLVLAAYTLAIFAYMGIYGFQYHKLGIMGFLGFVLIITANALFTPWLFLDIGRISGIIPGVGWKEVQETGATHVVGVIGGVSFVLGFLLFGADTIRAKVFNKWPAILLIIAGVMPLIYTWVPIGKLLPRIAGLALIAFSWNLWFMLKSQTPPTGQ